MKISMSGHEREKQHYKHSNYGQNNLKMQKFKETIFRQFRQLIEMLNILLKKSLNRRLFADMKPAMVFRARSRQWLTT